MCVAAALDGGADGSVDGDVGGGFVGGGANILSPLLEWYAGSAATDRALANRCSFGRVGWAAHVRRRVRGTVAFLRRCHSFLHPHLPRCIHLILVRRNFRRPNFEREAVGYWGAIEVNRRAAVDGGPAFRNGESRDDGGGPVRRRCGRPAGCTVVRALRAANAPGRFVVAMMSPRRPSTPSSQHSYERDEV